MAGSRQPQQRSQALEGGRGWAGMGDHLPRPHTPGRCQLSAEPAPAPAPAPAAAPLTLARPQGLGLHLSLAQRPQGGLPGPWTPRPPCQRPGVTTSRLHLGHRLGGLWCLCPSGRSRLCRGLGCPSALAGGAAARCRRSPRCGLCSLPADTSPCLPLRGGPGGHREPCSPGAPEAVLQRPHGGGEQPPAHLWWPRTLQSEVLG